MKKKKKKKLPPESAGYSRGNLPVPDYAREVAAAYSRKKRRRWRGVVPGRVIIYMGLRKKQK